MQLLLLPMLFLSGSLFPLTGLPTWLTVITGVNPLTYAVAPLRQIVFAAPHVPPAAAARFADGVTLFGYTLSSAACIGITCDFAVVFLALAVARSAQPSDSRGHDRAYKTSFYDPGGQRATARDHPSARQSAK